MRVLDVCCGSKMFWFNKDNPEVHFNDIRNETHTLCDGRSLEISPDTQEDFTKLSFADRSFKVVVFDPPHLVNLGESSWMAKKYGILKGNWKEAIRKGFEECFRVLDFDGLLIFKWNETQVKTSEVLTLAPKPPLFGHRSGKAMNTHWITFINDPAPAINKVAI
ncbi:SAM-dependent methyltransferase [Alteromonadaceae bacterium M269]|nr:SAM-dependent methyltransferase [Alteromonadaceae bacterium M269]